MSDSDWPHADLVPERINEIGREFWNSAVLQAGIKLGVFPLLESQARSATEVARQLDANPRFVEAFLESCVALRLLKKTDGQFANAPLASEFLLPEKPDYVGNLVLHITNYWHTWGNLDTLIREGRTELPFQNGYTDAATYWTDYMEGQHNRATAGQGQNLAACVDLGGGAASYSMALCAANPQLHATVIDAKEPLAIAAPLVAEQHLQDRITLREGDFHTVALGTDSDVEDYLDELNGTRVLRACIASQPTTQVSVDETSNSYSILDVSWMPGCAISWTGQIEQRQANGSTAVCMKVTGSNAKP